MKILGAKDVHREQMTFKLQDTNTGEVRRGRIPCDRESVRKWLAGLGGGDRVHIALEATTGWRFVVEEIQRVGYTAHLAEPAETAARRGPKGAPGPTKPTAITCSRSARLCACAKT